MAGLSNLFSNATLAEGLGLVAGLGDVSSVADPEIAAMEAELKALKEEVEMTTSGLSDAMWDDVNDDDLRFIMCVQAGFLSTQVWFQVRC